MTFTSTRTATDRFTQIANEALRDPRLSYRAKGILAAALTHEAGFSFGRPWIDSHGTEGRDAITTAIAELKALGYCRSARTKNDAGDWQGTTLAFNDAGTTENPSLRHGTTENAATENAATENAATENPSLLKKTIRRTPLEEEQVEIESTALQAAPSIVKAGTIQHSLLPSEPVLAKPGPKADEKASRWPIPPEFAEFAELIDAWLLRRKANGHKLTPWAPGATSSKGLRYAIEKGVAPQLLEMAADGGWQSLNHKEAIDRLATPSRSRFQSHNPEPQTLQRYDRSA